MARFLACTGWFCAVLVLCAVASPVLSQSTGPRNPTAADGWSNSDQCYTSNNQRATRFVFILGGGTLSASGFGFSIPADHIIDGIVVEVERSQEGLLAGDEVTLTGHTTGPVDSKPGSSFWPDTDSEAYETYGGGTDTWGVTWSPAEINSAAFGVQVGVAAGGVGNLQIDHIRVTVYHHLGVVPVTMTAFDAHITQSGSVRLTWSTASELNNDRFTVERSADGERYEALSEIPGSGTSNIAKHYTYEDRMPLAGRSYYRLMQTDYDGTSTYSPVVTVDNDIDPVPVLTLFPNPSNGTIVDIRLTGLTGAAEIPMAIYDASGRIIATHTLNGNGKATLEDRWFPDTPLSPGLYIVRAGPGLNVTRKLVVP